MTPTSRPDVEAIKAELRFLDPWNRTAMAELIAHIEALEARQVKLDKVVRNARRRCGHGSMNCVGSHFVKEALAALGDGG